ncbi:MAG: DUF1003 domain-containing protein [Ktedonobacteraceae bacterium]
MTEHQKHNEAQNPITALTDILDRDVETIVGMRMLAERKVGRHQRIIEKATSNIGRPQSFYLILLLVMLWIIASMLHRYLSLPVFDPPPYYGLQGLVGLSALLMTTAVLITQNRQEKLAEQRRHLDLQINLLTERKVSKLIELLEDLRKDIPTVQDRRDPEAQAMKESVDPHTALTSLNKTLKEAAKEYELEID